MRPPSGPGARPGASARAACAGRRRGPMCGAQPSSSLARVMSGRRCFGSFTGSASNTMGLSDAVREITFSASSSSVNSSGLPMFTGRCSSDSASRRMPSHQVVDVAERARLRTVAEDRDRLAREGLPHEGRDGAAVVGAHAGSVGVEDSHDRGVDALLPVVGHRQGLCVALCLVIDAARANWIDVAPIALGLRVHVRVAVDLARGRRQEARAVGLGQPEHVVRAVGADLERVQRQAQVVDGARRAGEVQHQVDRLVDLEVLDEVVLDEHELVVAQVLDVRQRPRLEVVDAEHAVAAAKQSFAKVGAEKPGPAGDDRRGNRSVLVRGMPPRRPSCMLARRKIHAAARKPSTMASYVLARPSATLIFGAQESSLRACEASRQERRNSPILKSASDGAAVEPAASASRA